MTWTQIRPRSLETRARHGHMQRMLATWSTEAGDHFVHGMLSFGPERDESPEADPDDKSLYLRMSYDREKDRAMPKRWLALPRITYGFRPSGSEKYLANGDLGLNFGQYAYFEVPNERRNKPKFYVPSRDEPGKLYELPGSAQMYEAMVASGWESRHEWTTRVRGNISYHHMRGVPIRELTSTEVVPHDTLDNVRDMILRIYPTLIEMAKKPDAITRKVWWQRYGMITFIDQLSVRDFIEQVGMFCESLFSATGRSRYAGDAPLFQEEYEYLQRILRDAQEERSRLEAEVTDKAVIEFTNDSAWDAVMKERWHLARGNLIDNYQRALQVEPDELMRHPIPVDESPRHPSDAQRARDSIDAGVEIQS